MRTVSTTPDADASGDLESRNNAAPGKIMAMTKPLRVLALGVVALFVLAGCMRFEVRSHVYSDNTIEQTMVMAVSQELVDAAGEGDNPLWDEYQSEEFQAEMAAVEDEFGLSYEMTEYHEDGYVGARFVSPRLPINALFGGGADLELSTGTGTLVRDGDYFIFTIPPSDPADTAAFRDLNVEEFGDMFKIEMHIGMVFPGDVVEHNGGEVIDGNQFVLDLEDLTTSSREVVVKAYAIDGKKADPASPLLGVLIAGIVVLGVALVVLLIVLAMKRRPVPVAGAPSRAPDEGSPDPFLT